MRKPVVAGSFYQGSEKGLHRQIEDCFTHRLGPGKPPSITGTRGRHILGLVSPHAGYVYSGPIATRGFFRLALEDKPDTIVIIGPNHRGIGATTALSGEERWETPLGVIEVDRVSGEQILATCPQVQKDDLAHRWEHSIEVQLPFLQYIYTPGFRIVPIVMLQQDLSTSQELGRAIASALNNKKGLIIASTDFTHYEPHDAATKKDHIALEAILTLNPEQLESVVHKHNITMCGRGPVMTMLTACKLLGATRASLLGYATSGDITGDLSQVVGYGAVEVVTD